MLQNKVGNSKVVVFGRKQGKMLKNCQATPLTIKNGTKCT